MLRLSVVAWELPARVSVEIRTISSMLLAKGLVSDFVNFVVLLKNGQLQIIKYCELRFKNN